MSAEDDAMEGTGQQMQGMARGVTVAVTIDELEVREESNPRRVRPTLAEDAAMQASIRGTGGPLQNLIGWRDESTNTIVITGGARRLAATRTAIEEGEIAPDIVIPVRIMENERAAMAAGLAENTVRAPMHWVDEVVWFRSLQSTQGWNERQIAIHFGVSTRRVREKLRLGGLCEGALELARGEQLAPDEMRALSAVGSQERQEEIIAEIQKAPENEWGERLRARIEALTVRGDDRCARFIGEQAWRAEGGQITRDLFAEDNDEWVWEDAPKLESMSRDELTKRWKASPLHDERWGRIEIDLYQERSEENVGARAEGSEANAADQQALGVAHAALAEVRKQRPVDPQAREAARRHHEEAIAQTEAWSDRQCAALLVVLSLDSDGMPVIRRGLEHPAKLRELQAQWAKADQDALDSAEGGQTSGENETQGEQGSAPDGDTTAQGAKQGGTTPPATPRASPPPATRAPQRALIGRQGMSELRRARQMWIADQIAGDAPDAAMIIVTTEQMREVLVNGNGRENGWGEKGALYHGRHSSPPGAWPAAFAPDRRGEIREQVRAVAEMTPTGRMGWLQWCIARKRAKSALSTDPEADQMVEETLRSVGADPALSITLEASWIAQMGTEAQERLCKAFGVSGENDSKERCDRIAAAIAMRRSGDEAWTPPGVRPADCRRLNIETLVEDKASKTHDGASPEQIEGEGGEDEVLPDWLEIAITGENTR